MLVNSNKKISHHQLFMRSTHIHASTSRQERKTAKDPLETIRVYDALSVRNALTHGLMDVGKASEEKVFATTASLYRVGLCKGVTEKRLIDFIGSKRPCRDMSAFRQAESEGLIRMEYVGNVPFYPRDPWGSF